MQDFQFVTALNSSAVVAANQSWLSCSSKWINDSHWLSLFLNLHLQNVTIQVDIDAVRVCCL